MTKRLFLLFPLLVLTLFVSAQQYNLRSKIVHNQTGASVEMATVRLLTSPDSTFVRGVQSDMDGYFLLDNIKAGKYILYISSIGYKDHSQNVEVSQDATLRTIRLKEDVALLESVEVRGTAVQLQVKGDTIEYNATAFKTPQDAVVEEMLKKMPGVEVDSEGNITVNGEQIKKIRVDGKKFFSDDVQMASKNIPAEMIDKIQIMDEKSEMAQLTGFEDDDTERIINLTLKPNRRKGYFANITAAGGMDVIKEGGENPSKYDPRYDANAFLNIMADKSQTSIVLGANNTNTMRSGRGRKNMQQGSGITNTQNLGINSNIQTNDDFKMGVNFSGNHATNVTENSSIKDSYIGEKTFTNTDNTKSNSNNWDTGLRLETEWRINDKNKLVLQPEISYKNSFLNSSNEYHYYNKIDSLDLGGVPYIHNDTTSYGSTSNNTRNNEIGGGLRAIYNYKFDKPGRTLTVNAKADFSEDKMDKTTFAEKTTSASAGTQTTDHIINKESTTNKYSVRISYVEPLYDHKHFLEAVLGANYTSRTNEKNQYNKDAAGEYTAIDSTYSSYFTNQFFSQTAELNYRYKTGKVDFMAGVRANPSQTYSTTSYLSGDIRPVENIVWNFAPTVNMKYTFGKQEYLRFDYRGVTDQPSIGQMEPSLDNSNPMRETVGNPSLNPAFLQNLKMFYTRYNSDLFSSFVTALSGGFTQNALVNNSIYDTSGKRYIQTVNAKEMPYNLFGMLMYNVPIIQKRLHFNTRTMARFSNQVGYTAQDVGDINVENLPLGDLSMTNNLRLMEYLSFTFTHDVVEVGARANITYSRTNNNLNEQTSNVIDWGVTGNITLNLPYQWTINTDIGYTDRYGYNTTSELDEIIWNASVDKGFLNNTAILSVKAFDMLNQRKNIREVVSNNSITYSTYNTLPTYVTLSFTYKLNKLGGRTMNTDERRPPFGGHPGGHGPGGGPGMGGPRL